MWINSSCILHCTYFVLHKYMYRSCINEHLAIASLASEEFLVCWINLPFIETSIIYF